ncbi:GGDEF domain-containing protein [Gandjariella thermophila]|uniref:Diguanylate cyclase n=1 Tax=Gandjariella thermophila TaxID=1931992 RepID=A0A4D4J556_9PSEU|nr:GGDEF domain-containing protein [Gandjariella thermophila]GDY29868.1 diguanylate cyclase [Gandjariella thermophila]
MGVYVLRDEALDQPGGSEPASSRITEAWLVGRARELIAVAQRSPLEHQVDCAKEIDELLDVAQRRGPGEPRVVAQLLRASALIRLSTPGLVELSDPRLDEMLAYTRRHGLHVLEAGAHALRARRALLAGADDAALTEAAKALAMIDEKLSPDLTFNQRTWERLLASVLVDIGLVLTQLGVYELADQVIARAHQAVRENGGPHEICVHLINRVRLLLGWGLRLERVGKLADARERFATASAIATSVEGPFRESLFPRQGDLPASHQVPVVGAAHALACPGGGHIDRLTKLLDHSMYARDLIVVSIALARCLEQADRPEDAIDVLARARNQVEHETSEQTLRLCLVREFARLSGEGGGERTTNALEHYATELETELWTLRESRVATLNARREHERLARMHGAITQQALQDPLTGLPNRRALDDHLDAMIAAPDSHPVSVALVDLDGFKGVNDRYSHAEGDDVLRVVVGTLRHTVRGDDVVARYGGDEFVVLLPGAPLPAAEAALGRAVEAVAKLPPDLSRGVTLSIGVVSLRPHETAAEALSRADAAMYLAKNRGGNQVASVTGDLDQITEKLDEQDEPRPDGARDGRLTRPYAEPENGHAWVLRDAP